MELARTSRSRPKYTGDRPAQRKLQLMTLRTIEFADGRRVTQLLPYRSSARGVALELDD
jgi:hypothetical protein